MQIKILTDGHAVFIREIIREHGVLDLLDIIGNVVELGIGACLVIGIIGVELGGLSEEHLAALRYDMAVDLSRALGVVLTTQSKQIAACDLRGFVVGLFQLVDIHTGITDPYLLGQVVTPEIIAVHHHINGEHLRSVSQTQHVPDIACDAVFEQSVVTRIRKQYPVLVFTHTQQIGALVQLELVGPLVAAPG